MQSGLHRNAKIQNYFDILILNSNIDKMSLPDRVKKSLSNSVPNDAFVTAFYRIVPLSTAFYGNLPHLTAFYRILPHSTD